MSMAVLCYIMLECRSLRYSSSVYSPFPMPEEECVLAPFCLNHVLDLWSRSGNLSSDRDCMLLEAPSVLLVQLMCYRVTDVIQKCCAPIHIPPVVQVPTLAMGELATVDYRCIATILHHGNTPTSGHYTTLLHCSGPGSWLLNDDRLPRTMTASEASLLMARDMYILCLQRLPA